jgi:hypothetical protein
MYYSLKEVSCIGGRIPFRAPEKLLFLVADCTSPFLFTWAEANIGSRPLDGVMNCDYSIELLINPGERPGISMTD